MSTNLRGTALVEKMKANVRRMSISAIDNPEWGSWGIMEYDRETGFAIHGRSGGRVLSVSEAAKFWQEAQS